MVVAPARKVGLPQKGTAFDKYSESFYSPVIQNATTMTLTITNLRVDERATEGWFEGGTRSCPYLICNVVFKCERSEDYHEDFTWNQAKVWSEEYTQKLTIDDPEKYEKWIMRESWDLKEKYDGYGKCWVHGDPTWQYIEKFDVFWFREWIADSTVTRAIIAELQHYKDHGCLPSVYRTVESSIILSHLRTLQEYWD